MGWLKYKTSFKYIHVHDIYYYFFFLRNYHSIVYIRTYGYAYIIQDEIDLD